MPDRTTCRHELKECDERQKQFDQIVKTAMKAVVTSIAENTPQLHTHLFYGAMGINPQHLAAWYIFKTDRDLAEARQNGLTNRIDSATCVELTCNGYPAEIVPRITIAFASDEDIQNKTDGNYWQYFK